LTDKPPHVEGVYWDKISKKYRVHIKGQYLGLFAAKSDAKRASEQFYLEQAA
jgi:hypothetical protein